MARQAVAWRTPRGAREPGQPTGAREHGEHGSGWHMRLVEQHRIDRHDPRWRAIDSAAFASKHLYTATLYLTRQAYIHQHRVIAYPESAREMKTSEPYRALPRKVSQWVLKQVALAWTSYFAACAAWEADPSRFLGHPKLPQYLDQAGAQPAHLHRAGHQSCAQESRATSCPRDWTSALRRVRRRSTRCASCRTPPTTPWR